MPSANNYIAQSGSALRALQEYRDVYRFSLSTIIEDMNFYSGSQWTPEPNEMPPEENVKIDVISISDEYMIVNDKLIRKE